MSSETIVFPWSENFKEKNTEVIDNIVRVDITFSKSNQWYNAKKYSSKEEKEVPSEIKNAQKKYDEIIDNQKKVPIDYLTDVEFREPFFEFHESKKDEEKTPSEDVQNFKKVQKELSQKLFTETKDNPDTKHIKQILVYPTFSIEGFQSFCIVVLSHVYDENIIYKLLGEVNKEAYSTAAEEFNSLIRKESIKSAKAAIMSRNMSHNIGSHVMAYLKQHLSSVTSILQDNILSELISAKSFFELLKKIELAKSAQDSHVVFTKKISAEEDSLALPFLVGLGHFISYLQERQDFIATIATDYIPYHSTVNFKDFIYDELNLDKRYLRHQDRKNLQSDNILLGNIARSEGLARTISPTEKEGGKMSDIVIKFRSFDGDPVKNDSNTIINDKAYYDLEFMRTIDLSLPGGMVGRQAIFSIVENIIRNAAKHGNWRSQGRLELTFDLFKKGEIEKNGNDLIEKKTNLEAQLKEGNCHSKKDENQEKLNDKYVENELSLEEVLDRYYSGAVDKDDLYIFTITDNVKTSRENLGLLRKALCEDYFENGVKKDGNKGIKELRISAAWLRGEQEEVEYYNPFSEDSEVKTLNEPQKKKKAPLIYVRLSPKGYLQYIFCLLIPKQVAIVSESFNDIKKVDKDKINETLADSYWKVFTSDEYIEERNKSYNFVLCDGEDCYKKIRPYSSSRIVKLSSVESTSIGVDINVNWSQLIESIINNRVSKEKCLNIQNCFYEYFSKCKNYKKCDEPDNDIICVDDKKVYARLENHPNTIVYKWTSSSENNSGHFIRSYFGNSSSRKEVFEVDGLFDGMNLIPGFSYYKLGNVLVTDGGGFGKYVYRTHHDMNDEFNRFMNELRTHYAGCQFVESITGNNSTDRLVRNDTIDDRWFFSHLRAMKLKIAIFDERLFSKLYGLEEVDFTRANAIEGTLEEMKEGYINLSGNNFAYPINNCSSIDELNKFILSNNALIRKLCKSEAETKNRSVFAYYQKGICVYTFVRDPIRTNKYSIYGLQIKPKSTDVFEAIEGVDHAKIIKLVDLSWDKINNKLNTVALPGSEYLTKYGGLFDYVSIHQGLLDKLYEAFNIKDNKYKVELTKKLYEFFKQDGKDSLIETSEGRLFMPGLSIHSGRSKPNQDDMPQSVPFIQYAAIEHATLDCKYSLVDLLDNARYEKYK